MKNGSGWEYRTRHSATRAGVLAALGAVVVLTSGCMGGQTAPGSVRNTAQTAPADLQMTCASAAATSLGVDSASVLPISSSQVDAQNYQVDLDVRGSRAVCIIGAGGNVVSVNKV